ncbi:MAG: class I SAM-dependent methyltransferase [Solirubrobacterales bacterium]
MEWGRGSYEAIGEQLLPAAEAVVERAAPVEGERVVDVGCGTGNGALLVAERGARVTGVDPAERLLEVARARFAERGLPGEFVLGDAASMPLDGASTDLVISVFGAIFAPDAAAAAAEMTRVLTPAGRIVLSAWIPEGTLFAAIKAQREALAQVSDRPAGPPQFAWHEADALGELFGGHGFSVSMAQETIAFEGPSAREFAEFEFQNHPMWIKTREQLGAERAEELRDHGMLIYEEGNEDPEAFRTTSRYVVAELRR